MNAPFNPFQPFGDNVRFSCIGLPNKPGLAAHLGDLCKQNGVAYSDAVALDFPNGSLAIIGMGEVYLCADAYAVFVAWVEGGAL